MSLPEERTRAMGFHIPDNWRDVVRLSCVSAIQGERYDTPPKVVLIRGGSGYTSAPTITFKLGPLICDGWDFGGDA
jgi:hypothetical protein